MQRPSSSAHAAATRDWWWIFDPRQSLRARAALSIGVGSVAFTVLLTWITGAVYRRALETHASALLETLAFQLSDKLDRTVHERYRTLQLAAALEPLRATVAAPDARRRVLDALQEAHPDFAWIGLTDVSGGIMVATGGIFEGQSAALRSWFRGARETPYAGPLREIRDLPRPATAAPDAANDARHFDLAVPVANVDGNFAGVLGAHVRWSWAHEVRASVVPEAFTRQQIGATVYAGGDVLLDSGASGWTQPPDPPALPDNRRGRGSMLEPTAGGTTYLAGYARSRGFKEYRGVGWLTVVRQPSARVFAPVAALRRTIAAWGFALTIVAIVTAWILAGRHARRLRSVRAAAERIHEGDILTVLPRPRGNSELARMCGALDDLVEDFRARQAPTANKDATPKP